MLPSAFLLCKSCFEAGADLSDKRLGIDGGRSRSGNDQSHQILGHHAIVQRVDASSLQLIGKIDQHDAVRALSVKAQHAYPLVDLADGGQNIRVERYG